jgi:hypothetical protein
MSGGSMIAVGVALGLGALLAGRAFYNRKFDTTLPPSGNHEIYVIQADDFGSLWSVPEAQAALDRVTELSKHENVYVFLFVHGWHHNAQDDPNLRDFKARITQIELRLKRTEFSQIRQEVSGDEAFEIIGIYVGWRGRSLPGFLDFFTMWWRKSAAERVGDGDVREFIVRLQRIYLRTNSIRDLKAGDSKPHFMGLVTIGHSFGGQVLLKSVASGLEGKLAERAPKLADTIVHPSSGHAANPEPERIPIDDFGDVNILLNPATEAYQYARIDQLYRQLSYPACQTPQLIVFSAVNDRARQFFFPIARGLTLPFRPGFRNAEQGALWGRALGELAEQRTHTLKPTEGGNSLEDSDYRSGAGRSKIRDWDFSSATAFHKADLAPLQSETDRIANSPVAIVYTDRTLIDGHNGIFKQNFWDFLVDYVTFLEGKRMLWRRQWLADGSLGAKGCPEPAP